MTDEPNVSNKRTVKHVRTSLRNYPSTKENLLTYILKALAITLEVFLHRLMGERYLTWPRIIMGLLTIWIIAHIGMPWDWQKHTIGGWDYSFPRFTPVEVGKVFGLPIPLPIFAETRFEGVSTLAVALSVYFAFAQWRVMEIFIYNRFAVDTHNRSSGEPYSIWDGLYMMFDKLNFRGDLIKQVCEPIVCLLFGLGVLVAAPRQFVFLGAWVSVASVALFVKAWLENRSRKKLFLDRVANRMDAEAVRLQQIDLEQAEDEEFDAVPPIVL